MELLIPTLFGVFNLGETDETVRTHCSVLFYYAILDIPTYKDKSPFHDAFLFLRIFFSQSFELLKGIEFSCFIRWNMNNSNCKK